MISPKGLSEFISTLIFCPSASSPGMNFRKKASLTMNRSGREAALSDSAKSLPPSSMEFPSSGNTRHHRADDGDQFLAGLLRRASLDPDPRPRRQSGEGQITDRAGRPHSGKCESRSCTLALPHHPSRRAGCPRCASGSELPVPRASPARAGPAGTIRSAAPRRTSPRLPFLLEEQRQQRRRVPPFTRLFLELPPASFGQPVVFCFAVIV